MQVLNLTAEQVNSLPPTERDQIHLLVSLFHGIFRSEGTEVGLSSANNLACRLSFSLLSYGSSFRSKPEF